MVVTDNGSNMVKALKLINTKEPETDSNSDDSEEEDNCEDDLEQYETSISDSDSAIPLRRFPCIAHNLQLVLKDIEKTPSYSKILGKTKAMTRKVRMSSLATQRLIECGGRTVSPDCAKTRSSNVFMTESLLKLKDQLVKVCNELKWDCCLASEWVKLEELLDVLKPFSDHTNLMQSDTFALSIVLPVIFDLSNQ